MTNTLPPPRAALLQVLAQALYAEELSGVKVLELGAGTGQPFPLPSFPSNSAPPCTPPPRKQSEQLFPRRSATPSTKTQR
eukprot:2335635-Rhodomonas_salina.1